MIPEDLHEGWKILVEIIICEWQGYTSLVCHTVLGFVVKMFKGKSENRNQSWIVYFKHILFSPYIHKTNILSYNHKNHGKKVLGHKFINLITVLPSIMNIISSLVNGFSKDIKIELNNVQFEIQQEKQFKSKF